MIKVKKIISLKNIKLKQSILAFQLSKAIAELEENVDMHVMYTEELRADGRYLDMHAKTSKTAMNDIVTFDEDVLLSRVDRHTRDADAILTKLEEYVIPFLFRYATGKVSIDVTYMTDEVKPISKHVTLDIDIEKSTHETK